MASLRFRLCPVSPAIARDACRRWHYSRTVAAVALLRLGVWEDDRFIGVIVFGQGACPAIGRVFGLPQAAVCELVRVAFDVHDTPVTQLVAAAIRLLRRARPRLRLLVSFADPAQGHAGKIYQAGNWIYCGRSRSVSYSLLCPDGVIRHPRSAIDLWPSCEGEGFTRIPLPAKYKYLYPLDPEMRARVVGLRLPAPRVASIDGDAPGPQPGQGGSSPTATLAR